MPGASNKITTREKAAILMHAAGLENDWTELYLIADDRPRKEAEKIKFLGQSVSKWKNSDKIKKCLAEYSRLFADRDAETRTKAREEERGRIEEENRRRQERGDNERTDEQTGRRIAREIDFYDPANQRTQINRIIREAADDPKTQLDAIKAIQQTQRDDKQAARDQKQVRTYLPLRCSDCPILAKARDKVTK